MTDSVEALLDNGYTGVDQIVKFLESEYENLSAIEGVKNYVKELKSRVEDSTPGMPVGWTDSMTKRVRDMLQEGDEVGMIADFLKSTEDTLQMNEIKCVEQWVEKYETEMRGPAQQD